MTGKKSANFNGKIFINPIPTVVTKQGTFLKILKENFFDKNKHLREPKTPPGPFLADVSVLNNLPSDTLRVTWLGHSSLLIEIDGKRFLTDPVWANRVSPFNFIGPVRFFSPPLALKDLPALDGIIISHDHYDHLDKETVRYLAAAENRFFCPLGVSKWLKAFGARDEQIQELDWWDEIQLDNNFRLTATPARHFSGRWLGDRFRTLWASWVISSSTKRVFYSADSGMFPGFTEIGNKYGPFDLTALEIGAANYDWEDIHMGPLKAADAHRMLKGKVMLPIHWGTFNLATHPWKEPIEDLLAYAEQRDIKLLLPAPGDTRLVSEFNSNWWNNYE